MEANFEKEKLHAEEIDSDDLYQLVTFNIAEEEFGVDILRVQEIIRMVEYTRVPNSPDFVVGVINLRGKVIPVIDFRIRLGLTAEAITKNSRIIVVELKNRVIGFIVDRVNEVIRIHKSVTEAAPAMVRGISSEYITAIGKLETGLLIILDLEKILFNDHAEQNQTES